MHEQNLNIELTEIQNLEVDLEQTQSIDAELGEVSSFDISLDKTGPKGEDGITPTIGENGNWFLGDVDTGKPSKGDKGDAGSIRFKITNVLPSSSIEWDGVTGTRETATVDFTTLYKVSDLVPTEEQLAGGTYKMVNGLNTTEYPININSLTSDGNVYEVRRTDMLYADIVVIKETNFDYPSSPGVYFYYDSWGPSYVSELSIPLYEEIDKDAIYMVQSEGSEDNVYLEYIYVNDAWEKIGSAQAEINLDNYVKFTNYASNTTAGVVKINSSYGIWKFTSGAIYISAATNTMIDAKTNQYCPIVPKNLDYAVKSVVGGHVTLTQEEYDLYFEPDENTYYYIVEE